MAEQQTQRRNQDAKVTLYWLDKSRSQRLVWLFEECKGLTYDVQVYKRQPNMMAPPTLKDVHPLGKSPVISVESPATSKPLVMAESGAIVEYVCDYFGQHLIPKRYQEGKEGQVGGETEQWLRYRFYMHYAEGSLMFLFVMALLVDNMKDGPGVPFFIKPITRMITSRIETWYLNPNLETHFSFLESQLATSPDQGKFLCGKDLTAADILMSFPLISRRRKMDDARYPKLTAYTDMLEKHEGYVRSTTKIAEITGEPFQAML